MYIGNGHYCYANSTAMLLKLMGENISPARIEVLTGMGIGANFAGGTFFLDSTVPDLGISKALEILGFSFCESAERSSEHLPFEDLKNILKDSPAIFGPLDMGYLTHNPNHANLYGADHYVLAYEIDDEMIYFHDPAGFPFVSIPLTQFQEAWKAENVEYRRGYYRCWHSLKRKSNPREHEIYRAALQYFRELYQVRETESREIGLPTGDKAILKFSEQLKNENKMNQPKEHMNYFLFQIAARRANDFAIFFQGRHETLSQLKWRQAKVLGKCHSLAVQGSWKKLRRELQQLAVVESDFHQSLMETEMVS